MSEQKKPEDMNTSYLGDPAPSQPMPDRKPGPGTTILTGAWNLNFKIGDETVRTGISERMVVGRAMEDETEFGLDLTPHGAYHFGVSRQHAILSLHDGFLYIEDLGSTNGTRINGFQLTPNQKYRLRDGDEIEFARLSVILRFEKPGA